jgi:tetratricopeptide (TPR) repeat protein
VALASTLARRIDPAARPAETASSEALRSLVEAKADESPSAAHAAYERAVDADPDFGVAYVAWAQTLLLRGDRVGAAAVVERARRRGPALAKLRRAELDLVWATLRGERAGRRGALLALSKLTPADPDVQRSLGREELVARRFGAAVDCYRKAAGLDPSSIPVWNQLIYAQAFNGNLAGARSAFSQYQRLAPNDANPLDSLADAYYYRGAFAEAEKYYRQAFDKSPSFLGSATLYKAARSRLMTGDVGGADRLYRRYAEERKKAKDVLSGYVDAQWLYLTGRRQPAIQAMSALLMKPDGSVAGLAKAQLAAWALAEGRSPEAASLAEDVLGEEQAPLARRTAGLVRYLAEPSLSVEMPEGAVKRLWESYRLLLAKRFQEATTTLARLADESDPLAPEQTGVLLAWAQIECGRTDLATPWLETYGVPQPGLEPPLEFLTFPRVFQLRSIVLDKQGRAQEAAKMREIYRRLSGA